ncbi:MAG TPA: hypothetical protein H9707_09070 [Candidatus Butyricicoccus avicola]|nr:hypothetical protein [Candidatus Butyricicoccus avicola]
MTQQELMTLLKIDLGIIGTAYDPQLEQLLSAAQSFIAREGVTLTDSVEDAQLIIMYAAYLYRKRATDEGMPRMLRWALNNRIFSGGGTDAP